MKKDQIKKFADLIDAQGLQAFHQNIRESSLSAYRDLAKKGVAPEEAMLEVLSAACYLTLKAAVNISLYISCADDFDRDRIGQEMSSMFRSCH